MSSADLIVDFQFLKFVELFTDLSIVSSLGATEREKRVKFNSVGCAFRTSRVRFVFLSRFFPTSYRYTEVFSSTSYSFDENSKMSLNPA